MILRDPTLYLHLSSGQEKPDSMADPLSRGVIQAAPALTHTYPEGFMLDRKRFIGLACGKADLWRVPWNRAVSGVAEEGP